MHNPVPICGTPEIANNGDWNDGYGNGNGDETPRGG